jgi:hypothetical protein
LQLIPDSIELRFKYFLFMIFLQDARSDPFAPDEVIVVARSSSKHPAKIVASARRDTATSPAPDFSSSEWRGILDSVATNDMEESCAYTWTPTAETGRSFMHTLAALGRRLSASTISLVRPTD